MRTFTITVGYNVCHVREVKVRAGAVARACERAIEIGDSSPDGWFSSDYESPTYVEAIAAGGEAVPVPAGFTEAGIVAPEVLDLRRGLEQVIGIGESGLAEDDAPEAVRRMVTHARAAFEKARH